MNFNKIIQSIFDKKKKIKTAKTDSKRKNVLFIFFFFYTRSKLFTGGS